MIELPRAALRAGDIAESAEFFSFGTNDLTQTTFGLSRDDSASFLEKYQQRGILEHDPFASLDIEGVGELIEIACERGRKARTDLKLGICGEHGGDPASVALLPQGRARLRLVLALPRADRAARRGAGGPGRPAQDGMTLAGAPARAASGRLALARRSPDWSAIPTARRPQALLDAAWRAPQRPCRRRSPARRASASPRCAPPWSRPGARPARRVGVIAVDPSSKASGGALLGDRVRIVHDRADEGSFVRSMAARDRLGGLADQTLAAMVVMRALFDRVLIETVGVGQSETDVAGVADTVVFCVQPGSGDPLQFMKAGIVEIPHLIVVTKADLGGAGRTRARRRGGRAVARHGGDGDWPLRALAVSSRSGAGMDGLMAALEAHRAHLRGRRPARRRPPPPERGLDRRSRCASVSAARALPGWAVSASISRWPPARQPFERLRELGRGPGEDAMSHPTDTSCIFCKIVAGQIPCFKLLEDETTIAFMDINPVNPGHALAVAKGHWPTVDVIPPEVLAAVARTAQRVAKAVMTELKPVGVNLLQANGAGRGPERAAPAHPRHAAPQPSDGAGAQLGAQARRQGRDRGDLQSG